MRAWRGRDVFRGRERCSGEKGEEEGKSDGGDASNLVFLFRFFPNDENLSF